VRDPNISYNGYLSNKAEDLGWISKSNLILWNRSLVTNECNLDKIAIIVNLSDFNMISFNGIVKITFLESPDSSSSALDPSYLQFIYYIYKYEGDYVLLGSRSSIAIDQSIYSSISGWMKSENIVIWDTKIALEPSWDNETSGERNKLGIKATIFSDSYACSRFQEDSYLDLNRWIIWDEDPYCSRAIGEWKRFPILEYNGYDGCYTVIVNGQIADKSLSISNEIKVKNFNLIGYAPMQIRDLDNPPFVRVFFITRHELGKMITIFEKLETATSGHNRRQRLQESWMEILKDHFGKVSDEEMGKMTFEEINEKVWGLPGTSELLSFVRLSDIIDESVVPKQTFEYYAFNIKRKKDALKDIFNTDNYPYSFKSLDEIYYWIPESILL